MGSRSTETYSTQYNSSIGVGCAVGMECNDNREIACTSIFVFCFPWILQRDGPSGGCDGAGGYGHVSRPL